MADESACKPGSVHRPKTAGDHPSRVYVAADLMRSTRKLGRAALERFLSDLAPGGVYRAARVTPGAGGLLHHRFTLTAQANPYGGLLSVALSRESPRVGVTHHLALWSPDFPRRGPKTSTRPPGRLVHREAQRSVPAMKAIVYDAPREFSLVDLPDPEPGPGEVVVRTTLAGVCGTDLHIHE